MKNKDLIKIEYIDERDNGIGSDIRDDYHTMSELYYNRMILFSVICGLVNEKKNNEVYAWSLNYIMRKMVLCLTDFS